MQQAHHKTPPGPLLRLFCFTASSITKADDYTKTWTIFDSLGNLVKYSIKVATTMVHATYHRYFNIVDDDVHGKRQALIIDLTLDNPPVKVEEETAAAAAAPRQRRQGRGGGRPAGLEHPAARVAKPATRRRAAGSATIIRGVWHLSNLEAD